MIVLVSWQDDCRTGGERRKQSFWLTKFFEIYSVNQKFSYVFPCRRIETCGVRRCEAINLFQTEMLHVSQPRSGKRTSEPLLYYWCLPVSVCESAAQQQKMVILNLFSTAWSQRKKNLKHRIEWNVFHSHRMLVADIAVLRSVQQAAATKVSGRPRTSSTAPRRTKWTEQLLLSKTVSFPPRTQIGLNLQKRKMRSGWSF